MKAIVDTQVFLWMASAPEKLSAKARAACESAELVLSVASVWEIGVKHEIGKLPLLSPPRDFLDRHIRLANLTILPIHYRHALRAASLPGDHRDPFDRMIAAQSLDEKIACITPTSHWNVSGHGASGDGCGSCSRRFIPSQHFC
jgi:PIN domain nuclease of toxin-antitoxin system